MSNQFSTDSAREPRAPRSQSRCPGVTRRSFLVDTGMGFTGLALGAMLYKDGVARAADVGQLALPRPKAKNVIWLFLCGGVSHVESFDPKPELTKHDGKSIGDTPFCRNPRRETRAAESRGHQPESWQS